MKQSINANRMTCFLATFFFSFFIFSSNGACATFYGQTSSGYQYVEKDNSGYGVYLPENMDPNTQPGLIFAFGRTQSNLMLSRDQLKDYADLWTEEAQQRGYIVVVPYWEPVVVENAQHTEKFFLEILHEVESTYNVNPRKILLTGFGLGAVQAFMMAGFYPDEFNALVAISTSPLHELIATQLIKDRLGDFPPSKLPPFLFIYGENDPREPAAQFEADKVLLTQRGVRAALKSVPDMSSAHDPRANAMILDWLEGLA